MRASTLFALTAAVIVGLGVAMVARYAGFFNPPPAVVAAKKVETQVLVAAKNLFANDMIDATGVKIRALRPEEVDDYQKNKDQYLPAVIQAGVLRIAQKNILADQPILKDQLKDLIKPDALNVRLLPEMRAISVAVPKDRSAGGLIQIGEWVDVYLTSVVGGSVRTATIAPKVRVIAKRNTLWDIFAPLPENKPVEFTLEVNPYRAALLESVRSKGDITLTPLGAAEKAVLEAKRNKALQDPKAPPLFHFLPPDSPEAKEEDARVEAFNRGELTISDADLIRIFGLTTAPPPLASISIERLIGTWRVPPLVFSNTGAVINDALRRPAAGPALNNSKDAPPMFQFRIPECPTCGKKTKS